MKTTMMVMALLLAACGDQPRLVSPAEVLADCEYHELEEC
jgi:hypothetical protein